ncbi:GNAT family N-acetyltransferase [Lampropedia aestuarii]|uniref:GNAT family N-acetyltransferase n=1 Tax=Lampropedia aestuarii TaxID=2562762 RepID=UPI00246932E8|nr:GNAT family N-acetyltransferase [Lampropedia aestuarii]MDH5856753.1 GNAT family N-acetyltransferase [Lampropedia aestuarii]
MPTNAQQMHIHTLQTQDIDDVLKVQSSAYPTHLLEDADFFHNRLALSAATCWSARDAQTGAMLGYLIAYPWDGSLPPSLNVPLQRIPAQATHWFLHDCAVTPAAQGRQIGQRLYQTGIAHARTLGLHSASLVALETAVGYWQRLGFEPPANPAPELHSKLAGYGVGARYLQRSLHS